MLQVGQVAQHQPVTCRVGRRRKVLVGHHGQVGPGGGDQGSPGDQAGGAPDGTPRPRPVVQQRHVVLVHVGDDGTAAQAADSRAPRAVSGSSDRSTRPRARSGRASARTARDGHAAPLPGADGCAGRPVDGPAETEHLDLQARAEHRRDLAVQAGVGDVVARGDDAHVGTGTTGQRSSMVNASSPTWTKRV